MSWTLEQSSAACQRALTNDPGPGGRKKVCEIVQDVLKDEAFVARHVGDDGPERKILYEDPKLGFCILAHVYQGAKESNPHDHGLGDLRSGPGGDRDERLGARPARRREQAR